MVWPDVNPHWVNVDRYPDTEAKNTAYEVFDRLDKLDPLAIGAEQDTAFDGTKEGIPFLRFSPAALELFNEWRVALEERLRSGELHQALESHFSKYRKLIPALALIIHLADDGAGPVTEDATLKALAWGEYLESHAKRCYGSATQGEAEAAKAILTRIKKGDLKSPFSSRDVWRPGWTGLDREATGKGLSMLVDYGYLTIETKPTSRKPATLYHMVEVEA
jgi:putative DNA primase/helicase